MSIRTHTMSITIASYQTGQWNLGEANSDQPWVVRCKCGWELAFASTADPTELARAAYRHVNADTNDRGA